MRNHLRKHQYTYFTLPCTLSFTVYRIEFLANDLSLESERTSRGVVGETNLQISPDGEHYVKDGRPLTAPIRS